MELCTPRSHYSVMWGELMPVYNSNILPDYTSTLWKKTDADLTDDGTLHILSGGQAVFHYAVTDYSAQGYMLISCPGCSGTAFISIHYQGIDDNAWRINTVPILTDGISLPIVLQETDTQDLYFYVYSIGEATVEQVSAQLVEQAIRSVDIEYASGTSRVEPPVDGWQSTPPQWQSDRYIWQRTATTFVDGHTEYSDPVCIQDSNSVGIYEIVEEYYLSTSEQEPTDGEWLTEQPAWESSKYIWTRSKITWTDLSISYTDPVLAKALNQANEHAQDAQDKVEELDKNLDQDGIFNRLTNNGTSQGLFIDNGDIYINATYIRSGRLEVLDTSGNLVFRADMTSKSVYLAGFTAINNAIYYNRSALQPVGTSYTGTYIGTKGFSVGGQVSELNDAYLYLVITSGKIVGGLMSTGVDTGTIAFDSTGPHVRGRNQATLETYGNQGAILVTDSGITLTSTSFITVGYVPRLNLNTPAIYIRRPSGSTTDPTYIQTRGGTFTLVSNVYPQTYSNVTCNLAVNNGNITWQYYSTLQGLNSFTTTSLNFISGLLTISA